MKLVGYCDPWSVAPGETVRFMVSAAVPRYEATIVRLIHGDPNPAGPGFKEEPVATGVDGSYPGREQGFPRGSYVRVPDAPALGGADGFVLQVWVYPTTPGGRAQGLLTKWDDAARTGYALVLDEAGAPALWLGDGTGHPARVSTDLPLRACSWTLVGVRYDAASGAVLLQQEPRDFASGNVGALGGGEPAGTSGVASSGSGDAVGGASGGGSGPDDGSPGGESGGAAAAATVEVRPVATAAPLLMAAWCASLDGDAPVVAGHFNGKLDGPRLERGGEVVAVWDFAADIGSARVRDGSGNGHDGTAVNMPMRGVTGHTFSGCEVDFRLAPDEYNAIFFHDDDLEDAGWATAFELVVPADLPSGVYAARLRAAGGDPTGVGTGANAGTGTGAEADGGTASMSTAEAEAGPGAGDDSIAAASAVPGAEPAADAATTAEDYVPFFVRPPRGTATARVAFLAPTFSYLAYANEHITWRNPDSPTLHNPAEFLQPQDHYAAAHRLLSLYDHHADGTGCCYASRLRPLVNMRPKYDMALLRAPHQFNADLHLVDWLEATGTAYDVVTDEDLHAEGVDLLRPYAVVLSGSHHEYWSAPMLDGLSGYLAGGGRFLSLCGNGYYWPVATDPARPHILEVRRGQNGTGTWRSAPGENHLSTTGEPGGLWRDRGRPPQALVGVGMAASGFDVALPYRRTPDSFDPRAAFIFDGVGTDEPIGDAGLVMGGAAGLELDRADAALGTPPHALVVATAGGFSASYTRAIEEVTAADGRQGGTRDPEVRADIVFFETPRDGAVFAVGSITWCGGLSHNGYDNPVSRITGNVLRAFASERWPAR